jgi:hypothetical protein
LEFGARHGFVVRRAYAVPRQPVWVVIVLRPEHTLLVAVCNPMDKRVAPSMSERWRHFEFVQFVKTIEL